MERIILHNGLKGGKHIIRLEFPFNFELKELVKIYPGCRWDTKLKVWSIPYSASQLKFLAGFFQRKGLVGLYSTHNGGSAKAAV